MPFYTMQTCFYSKVVVRPVVVLIIKCHLKKSSLIFTSRALCSITPIENDHRWKLFHSTSQSALTFPLMEKSAKIITSTSKTSFAIFNGRSSSNMNGLQTFLILPLGKIITVIIESTWPLVNINILVVVVLNSNQHLA